MELGVMLFVKNMKAVIAFYRDVVGLVPDEEQPFPEHRFFRFNTGGGTLCLHSASKPNEGRQKLVFEVESVSAVHQRLESKGKRLPKLENEEGHAIFGIRDPEGNRIQFSGNYQSPEENEMELGSVILYVKDMKGIIAFYRDAVGLVPDEEQPFPEHRFFRFNTGGCKLCLHSASEPNGGRQKFVFQAESVSAVHQRLRSNGKRLRKLENSDGQAIFDIRDPEGNRLQFGGKY